MTNENDGNRNNDDMKNEVRRYEMMRRLDDVIDRSGDSERIWERDSLRIEGMELLGRSRELLDRSIEMMNEAERLMDEKEVREEAGDMDYDKLAEWYREVDRVEKKINDVNEYRIELDRKYKELKGRVNKFYGIDIIRDYNDLSVGTPGEDGYDVL